MVVRKSRRRRRSSKRKQTRSKRRSRKRVSRKRVSKRRSRKRVSKRRSRKRTSERRSRKRVSRKQQGGAAMIKKIKDFFNPPKQDETPEETQTAPKTSAPLPEYGSTEYAYGFKDDGKVPKTVKEILDDPNDPKNTRSLEDLSGLAIELE
jgi:hypothetical protein